MAHRFAAGYHMPITRLRFSNVGPFDDIEFEFDPQVNVFTGPNNSGKSTALWVLGDIAVFPFVFPQRLLTYGISAKFEVHIEWESYFNVFNGQLPCDIWETEPTDPDEGWTPLEQSLYYEPRVLETIGFSKFIPALRQSTDFRSIGPTPAHKEHEEHRAIEEEDLSPDLRKRLTLVSEDASLVSDEAVIQEIIDLDYRSYLRDDPARRNIIVQVGEIASEITDGFPIGFSGVSEDIIGFFPEFSTVDGPMPLNTLSQGTQSIVQWLAHLLIGYAAYYDFPKTLKDKPGVLIVDEIDAHLHPSWQRRIIPTLTKHFPSPADLLLNPLAVDAGGSQGGAGAASSERRRQQGDRFDKRGRIMVAWSADEILRNFLGVRDPTDQKTVVQLERLRELQGKQEMSAKESEELESLSDEVNEDLLSGPVAAQVDRFIQALEQAKAGDL